MIDFIASSAAMGPVEVLCFSMAGGILLGMLAAVVRAAILADEAKKQMENEEKQKEIALIEALIVKEKEKREW